MKMRMMVGVFFEIENLNAIEIVENHVAQEENEKHAVMSAWKKKMMMMKKNCPLLHDDPIPGEVEMAKRTFDETNVPHEATEIDVEQENVTCVRTTSGEEIENENDLSEQSA